MVGHRNCSVVSCGNSGVKLNKWQETLCETHQCKNGTGVCNCQPPFKLFPFPTKLRDLEKRKRWLKAISRQGERGEYWDPDKNARVCSIHFVGGHPTEANPDPVLKLGYKQLCEKKPRKAPASRCSVELSVPSKKQKPNFQDIGCSDSVSRTNLNEVTKSSAHETTSVNICVALADHDYTKLIIHQEKPEEPGCTNQNCKNIIWRYTEENRHLHELVEKLKQNVAHWRKKFFTKKAKPFSYKCINSDNKMRTFTGIPSCAIFNSLFELLEKNIPKLKYWHGEKKQPAGRNFTGTPQKSGRARKLCGKDEFLLTLMKIKLGSVNADLADRFGVSTATVSQIFHTWIKFLAMEWKCLINNPPKHIALQHLPKKFCNPKYKNVRHIIDCSEIFIETPSDPMVKAATWSDYKHHHTMKILVSILPCGAFNFVSEAWGGRTSDVCVTRDSGFYDILEYGDEVMADKGFTIAEELLLRNCQLHIPPGKRGQEQLPKKDVAKTKQIANLRIFVEQAIRRLKTFRILKYEMPILLLDKIDDIVSVCAALCNLYPKLCK